MPEKLSPCCPQASAQHLRDLDHVYQFDFDLFECTGCGDRWVYASREDTGGWERVTPPDAERMLAIPPDEVRAFMRGWAEAFN